jgi:xanthine/CO dehydrogenase XdhC/CoxF family maturation factor
MDDAGLAPRFVQGRRYTDDATLGIVEKVLATELNHDLVARLAPEAGALAVVMTHHYVHDVPLLRDLLPLNLSYLGLLGPKKRADRILADLAREGLTLNSAQLARLHAPVGLDLGAERPAEVALAILAEMQAALTRRDARPLRERTRPIHD